MYGSIEKETCVGSPRFPASRPTLGAVGVQAIDPMKLFAITAFLCLEALILLTWLEGSNLPVSVYLPSPAVEAWAE